MADIESRIYQRLKPVYEPAGYTIVWRGDPTKGNPNSSSSKTDWVHKYSEIDFEILPNNPNEDVYIPIEPGQDEEYYNTAFQLLRKQATDEYADTIKIYIEVKGRNYTRKEEGKKISISLQEANERGLDGVFINNTRTSGKLKELKRIVDESPNNEAYFINSDDNDNGELYICKMTPAHINELYDQNPQWTKHTSPGGSREEQNFVISWTWFARLKNNFNLSSLFDTNGNPKKRAFKYDDGEKADKYIIKENVSKLSLMDTGTTYDPKHMTLVSDAEYIARERFMSNKDVIRLREKIGNERLNKLMIDAKAFASKHNLPTDTIDRIIKTYYTPDVNIIKRNV